MTKPLRFDVKSRTPHANDDWDNLDSSLKRTYREINFMTHLLLEARYMVIHGEFKQLIPHVLGTIEEHWPTEYEDAKEILIRHLDVLARDRAVQNGLVQLDLHLRAATPDELAFINKVKAMRDELEALVDTKGDARFPVCFPFIEAQEVPDFPSDSTEVTAPAAEIRNLTMLQLYDLNGIRGKTPAIKRLRDAGVLRTRTLIEGGQGNGLKCQNGNSCVPSSDPRCFCSLDSQNQCSAMTTC